MTQEHEINMDCELKLKRIKGFGERKWYLSAVIVENLDEEVVELGVLQITVGDEEYWKITAAAKALYDVLGKFLAETSILIEDLGAENGG